MTSKTNIVRMARMSGFDEKFAKENQDLFIDFANKIMATKCVENGNPVGWITSQGLYGLVKARDKKFFNIYPTDDGHSKIPVFVAKEITE